MDIYRVPANVVPSYLKGRPRTLIKHCLVRKTKSNKFTHDSIHQNDTPGSFDIIKDSGAKHIVSFALESDYLVPVKTGPDGISPVSISLQFSVKYLNGLGNPFLQSI